MVTERKLSELVDMTKEDFGECLKKIGAKLSNDKAFYDKFLKDPKSQAEKEGLRLKKDVSIKIVKSEEEANILPSYILPLVLLPRGRVSLDELQKVAGGGNEWGKGNYNVNSFVLSAVKALWNGKGHGF